MILLSPPVRLFACAALTIGLCVASGAALAGSASPGLVQVADAAGDAAEKSAFEAAKELGTIEAWEAFLKNFPKGFHADLARAYLSRLTGGQSQTPATGQTTTVGAAGATNLTVTRLQYEGCTLAMTGPGKWRAQRQQGGDLAFDEASRSAQFVELVDATRNVTLIVDVTGGSIQYNDKSTALNRTYAIVAASADPIVPAVTAMPAQPVMQAVAGEHPCAELPSLRSLNSDTRASITFRNQSGMMRGIMWVDFQGQLKPYADLQSGQQVVFDSYLTHPWMVTDGPGNCLRIVLPEPGGSVVVLEPDYQAPSSSGQVEYVPPAKAKKAVKAKTPSCGKGKMLVDGRCIAKRDKYTFCGPGYRVKGNKCVPGYKAPPPDAPLSTEQSNAVAQGCPTGQVWNEAEGCHEDD